MKNPSRSSCKPLLRAFYAFLIAVTVLWATPRNAQAQLYVPDRGAVVSEYNAVTGDVISPDFIARVDPFALLVDKSGQQLFVADFDTVGKYDATTGLPINTRFITGLNRVHALALSGDKLFVADAGIGKVSVYDARTGQVINANLIPGWMDPQDSPSRTRLHFSLMVSSSWRASAVVRLANTRPPADF